MHHLDLNFVQFLWLMVSLQLIIFASIWLLASFTMNSYQATTRMFGLFNLLLALNVLLVALRGQGHFELLTRMGANLTGLTAFFALWVGGCRLLNPGGPMRGPWWILLLGGSGVVVFSLVPGHGNQRVAMVFLAIACMIVHSMIFLIPAMRRQVGLWPVVLTRLIGWIFVSVIVVRAFGGLFLNWPIEVDRGTTGTLAFAYFSLACATTINSILAYVLVRMMVFEVEQLATHDSLTGLLNRRAFDGHQAVMWRRWKTDDVKFAVICLDVDHFKEVNDRLGHLQGDRLLVHIAEVLQRHVRSTDILARTGGEEFTVLIAGPLHADGLFAIAEDLRKAIAVMRPWSEDADRRVSISAGVSIVEQDDERPENVLTRADMALYRAKAAGRNCVEWG